MNVVDLHPDDLLDKEASGELTESERARLAAHLERCATCRFEREVRADFAEELAVDEDSSAQRLLALVERDGAAELAPHRAPDDGERTEEHRPRTISSRPSKSRRATRVALLVAAAVFVGGAATAGGGARVWSRIASVLSEPPAVEHAPSAALVSPTPPRSVVSPPPVASSRTPDEPDEVATTPSPVVLPVAVRFADPVESAASIFDAASEAGRRGDYARAVALHRRLQATHPSSREAHVSHATVGRILLDRGDAAAALASFDAYQARGSGALEEAVMVGRATALERLGKTDDARAAWSALLSSFPETPYADHARSRVVGARMH